MPKAKDDAQTDLIHLTFNLESALLAIHLLIDGQEQVLIYTRSNWKWYCKQQILIDTDQLLESIRWVKKQQLCLVYTTGKIEYIEFSFTYNSSMTNFNHASKEHSGYVAFIDGPAINLTPLGKFVMPPPMFEKQVSGLPSVPSCLSLYGNSGVAYCEAEDQICTFDCAPEKVVPVFYTLPLESGYRVTYLLNFGVKDNQ